MVIFSLSDRLGDGIYTVAWRVSSADSHPIEGAFTFSVGAAGRGPAMMDVPAPPGRSGVGVAFGVVCWLGYAGAGGVAFLMLCWPDGWAVRRAHRLLRGGWAGSIVAAVAAFLIQGPYATASPPRTWPAAGHAHMGRPLKHERPYDPVRPRRTDPGRSRGDVTIWRA